MIFINILLNNVSPKFKKKILDFIKSLKPTFSNSTNEWDSFSVKLLFTLFDVKD